MLSFCKDFGEQNRRKIREPIIEEYLEAKAQKLQEKIEKVKQQLKKIKQESEMRNEFLKNWKTKLEQEKINDHELRQKFKEELEKNEKFLESLEQEGIKITEEEKNEFKQRAEKLYQEICLRKDFAPKIF